MRCCNSGLSPGARLPKAASATASTHASVPPATMTSAWPPRMRWKASPIASAPAAHAVAAALLGPFSLCRMLTAPAGEFASMRVTRKGLILRGLAVLSCTADQSKVELASDQLYLPFKPVLHKEKATMHAQGRHDTEHAARSMVDQERTS